MNKIGYWLLAMTIACSTLSAAESVRLLNGGVMVGDVSVSTSGEVVVRTRFPEQRELVLSPEEIDPASLYWIHERRADKTEPQALLQLANLASDAGLYGVAIGDFLALKDLDSQQGQVVDRRVKELTEKVAEDILSSAQSLLEEDQVNAALLYLHTIEELYPRTNAAKQAAKLMGDAHRRAGAAAVISKNTVPESKVQPTLEKIVKNLESGDVAREKAGGHIGSTIAASKQRRSLDKAIRYYSKAWDEARALPAVITDEQVKGRADSLRERAKQKLVKTYLEAASLQLQRGSIPKAEDYCNAACELDPGNKDMHQTHRLILEAKAYGF